MSGTGVGGVRRWVSMCVLMGIVGCDDAAPTRAPGSLDEARLEVVGLNGRRVTSGERYWIPFDHDGEALPLWEDHREALAIRNIGGSHVTVTGVTLWPTGDSQRDELRVLAPTRASRAPLADLPVSLAPGEQLDIDVLARLVESGRRSALLRIDHRGGAPIVITLLASGEGQARLWTATAQVADRAWGAAHTTETAATVSTSPDGQTLYAAGWISGLAGVPETAWLAAWSPGGALRWSRVLHAPGVNRPTSAPHGGLGLCADDAGVVVVGRATLGDHGAAWLARVDRAGRGSVARLWWPAHGTAARATDCAVAGDRVWVTGGVGDGPDHGEGSMLLMSVRPDDLAPIDAWTHSATPATSDRGYAVIATPSGPLLGGRSGGGGLVLRPAIFATQLDAPVVGLASAPGDDGSLAVLDVDGDLDVVRLNREGGVRWRRQLTHPRPTWTLGPLVRDGDALFVSAAGGAGAWAAELDVARGTVRTAAVLTGPDVGAWHIAGLVPSEAGLTVLGDGMVGSDVAGAWYHGTVSASPGDTNALALAPKIAPLGPGRTALVTTEWWWWDPSGELAEREATTPSEARHDVFVTTLPWQRR